MFHHISLAKYGTFRLNQRSSKLTGDETKPVDFNEVPECDGLFTSVAETAYSSFGSDSEESFSESIQDDIMALYRDFKKWDIAISEDVETAARVALHITPVFTANTFFTRVMALVRFLDVFRKRLNYSYFVGLLTQLVAMVTNITVPETDFNQWISLKACEYEDQEDFVRASLNLNKFADFLEGVSISTLKNLKSVHMFALRKVLAAAVAHSMFSSFTPQLLWAGVLKSSDIMEWESGEGVPELIASTFRAVSSSLRAIAQGDTPEAWDTATKEGFVQAVTWLDRNENCRYARTDTCENTEGFVPNEDWVNLLNRCNSNKMSLKYGFSDSRVIQMAQTTLAQLTARYEMGFRGARPIPFNIGLVSEPGCGKSTMIAPTVARICLDELGVKYDDINRHTYYVNAHAKYLDNYAGFQHNVVVVDELGCQNPKLAVSGDGLGSQLSEIMGEQEFSPNMADLPQKGKVRMQQHVTVLMSNKLDMGLSTPYSSEGRAAIMRRFAVFAYVTPNPKYCKMSSDGNATSTLDSSKIPEGARDVRFFTLYECTKNGPAVRKVKGEDGKPRELVLSSSEFYAYVAAMARKHVAKTRRSKKDIESIEEEVEEARNVDMEFINNLVNETSILEEEDEFNPLSHPSDYGYERAAGIVTHVPYPIYARAIDCLYDFGNLLYAFVALLIGGLIYFVVCIFISEAETWKVWHAQIKENYDMARSDLFMAATLIQRAERLLNRWKRARKHMILAALGMGTIATVIALSYSNRPKYEKTAKWGSRPDPDKTARGHSYQHNSELLAVGKSAAAPKDVIEAKIMSNSVYVNLVFPKHDVKCHLLGVKGQYWIGPAHSFKDIPNEGITVQAYHRSDVNAIHAGIKFKQPKTWLDKGHVLKKKDVVFFGYDLAMVYLSHVQAVTDITGYLPELFDPKGGLQTFKGKSISFAHPNYSEFVVEEHVANAGNQRIRLDGRAVDLKGIRCQTQFRPYLGLCGSPFIAQFNKHSALAGIVIAAALEQHQVVWEMIDARQIAAAAESLDTQLGHQTLRSSLSVDDMADVKEVEFEATSKHHAHWLLGDMRKHGEFLGIVKNAPSRKMKSKVKEYRNSGVLKRLLKPWGYYHNLVAPKFNAKIVNGEWMNPERKAILDMSDHARNYDSEDMLAAAEHIISKLKNIRDDDGECVFSKCQVIDSYTAINGDKDNQLFGSMPKNTGSGYPMGGKKYKHLVKCPTEQAPDGYDMNPELQKRVGTMIDTYSQGERYGVIFNACPKDEPRDEEKVKQRKIRIFTIGGLDFFIVTKMFFGHFVALFTKHFLDTETVGGVNAFSPDWGKIFERLSRHPWVVNADYRTFDKSTSSEGLMMCFHIMITLMGMSPHYDAEKLAVCHGIATEISDPIVLFGSELWKFNGSLSSGVFLTFVLNNLMNSIYNRMAFMSCWRNSEQGRRYNLSRREILDLYDEHTVFYGMGDDNTHSMSDFASQFFNFKTIKAYFTSIGVGYTPANKEADDYVVEPVEKATIGKRTWVYDSEYKLWKAPIERASVLKSLTIRVESSVLSAKEQQIAAGESALYELSQYGREEYNAVARILGEQIEGLDVPSYEFFMDKQADLGFAPWIPDSVEMEELDVIPLASKRKTRATTAFRTIGAAMVMACGLAYCWNSAPAKKKKIRAIDLIDETAVNRIAASLRTKLSIQNILIRTIMHFHPLDQVEAMLPLPFEGECTQLKQNLLDIHLEAVYMQSADGRSLFGDVEEDDLDLEISMLWNEEKISKEATDLCLTHEPNGLVVRDHDGADSDEHQSKRARRNSWA